MLEDFREGSQINQPIVEEIVGGTEIYADGVIFRDKPEMMTAVHYVERHIGGKIKNFEVARVHFTRPNWAVLTNRALMVLRQTIGKPH